jgi:hypothetical protein
MNDDLTQTLSEELEGRAHAMDGATLHLADVRGRARSIRRRRTATAVAGVAAAVVVIVPVASFATHSGGKPEPAPATQSVSPTPTQTGGHQPPPGVLDVSDLPTGAPPAIDYVYNGRLHFRDGGAGTLNTTYAPDQFVEMDDGSRVWLTADDGGDRYVEIQDSDGGFHDPVPSGAFELGINPQHTIAAWLDTSGQVIVWEARASDPRPLGDPIAGSNLQIGPVSGEKCSLACSVVVNARDDGQPWEVTDSGSAKLLDGGYRLVADTSQAGLTIGWTKITDTGTCSTLLGGGEFQGFATCKNTLQSFSPDGQLVLGLPAYPDGAGPNEIAMYDLEGTRLFDRGSTRQVQPTFQAAEWEDSTHVLAPIYQDGNWALVRIASDGSMEYAVGPRPGEDLTLDPYVLPRHPLSSSD